MIRRVFVEHKESIESASLLNDLISNLKISNLKNIRIFQRYDIEDIDDKTFESLKFTIFCEAPVENVFDEISIKGIKDLDYRIFGVEFLPGQFDQRADSAQQCIQIMAHHKPSVSCAKVYILEGNISDTDFSKIKSYLINSVDSREASLDMPETLMVNAKTPNNISRISGFISFSKEKIEELHKKLSLAMSIKDLLFCQDYFRNNEKRDPSMTEIKLLDTYWSDHCRHTTFLTKLESCKFNNGKFSKPIKASWDNYLELRKELKLEEKGKNISLMDIALIGMRYLRKVGKLSDLEESEEINAASIVVEVDVNSEMQKWLVMFKNETHNHPTEIEPFGGAATCLGGAIRDPLSGRSYVYQAMRITGSGNPLTPFEQTLEGKLPQKKITVGAANGYSSYGNQIGLATGKVQEIYHDGYVAKRMEIGAVIAAAPSENVFRGVPSDGDSILLVGGRTGRDGIGGATGSSKDHNEKALENSAEVQKGDAPMERKLQRLFRNPEVSKIIKRCNDFGAGGVSVAIGELAPSLEINLDAVSKKYDGLDGTELAISESQERMAVVVNSKDVERFIELSAEENLECNHVATVKSHGRLIMKWRGDTIVNLSRDFLDTNGTVATAVAEITEPSDSNPFSKNKENVNDLSSWKKILSDLNICSQKGLIERFDSSIGASAVNHPFGGKYLLTPTEAMTSKIPLIDGDTNTGTIFAHGFNPNISLWSPYHGAVYAVLECVAKIVASGGDYSKIRLTFQEYFEKLRDNPERWGKPLASLLGGLEAQIQLGIAAIGGKDSMSGSFKDLDVPPTLVSFGIVPTDVRKIISPEFKKIGSKVAIARIKKDDAFLPIWEDVKEKYSKLHFAISNKKIISAHTVTFGGIAEAISKMCFGNKIGFKFINNFEAEKSFDLDYGAIILELATDVDLEEIKAEIIGETISDKKIVLPENEFYLDELISSWESKLEPVFPTKAKEQIGEILSPSYENKNIRISSEKFAKPRVFIPVFPGTNCEYDTAKAFNNAGAVSDIFVFKNRNDDDVSSSLIEMEKRIKNSQIIMIPGGFSAGDEPAGSGKFITSVFRNPNLKDAVTKHLKDKKYLILGICNGFQALIKLGLVPFGEIRDLDVESPTLTYNNIGRHISCYTRTRVASKLSPWLSLCEVGEDHIVPVSHGEGKFIASESVIKKIAQNGQIATQYVDFNGKPSSKIEFNPNGSIHAIEGITSPCGLVLGKMAHSERFGTNVGKNIYGNKIQPIFEAGVKYFS